MSDDEGRQPAATPLADPESTTTDQPLLPRQPSQRSRRSIVQRDNHLSQSISPIKRKPVATSNPAIVSSPEKEPSLSKQPTRPKSTFAATLRWWIPEILASLMAVISLLAIAIVLEVYNGHTLDSLGLPYSLSLNALVAILATLHRMFLTVPLASCISQEGWLLFVKKRSRARRLQDLTTYDDASKGAWGSLLLIFKSPRQVLTVIAALVTIMSLGTSTFVQQLIVFQNVEVKHPSSELQPGNISRTVEYNDYFGAPAQGGPSLNVNMTASIYSGILGVSATVQQPDCRSGNCTWPSFSTLAVCGGCAGTFPINTTCETTTCNYTLPSGNVFQLTRFNGSFNNAPTLGTGWQSQYAKDGGRNYNASLGDRYYVANWEQMGAPYGLRSVDVSTDSYVATECALWMCVNTYNVSVQSARVTEELVSSYDKADTIIEGGWLFGPSGYEGNLDFSITPPNKTSATVGMNETGSYTFSLFGGEAMLFYIESLVDGKTASLNDRGDAPSDAIAAAMWHAAGSNFWLNNLAKSITYTMRQAANAYNPAYVGKANSEGVKIVWWWITFPAVSVASAIVLLFITIARTQRSEINSWKGSPLMFLFCEVDEDLKTESQTAACFDNVAGMKKVEKERVRLRLTERQRWTFERA